MTAALVSGPPATLHSPALLSVLGLAALGTTAVFVLGLVAYRRRPTRPYLLVTLALGMLVARTVVGLATVFGYVSMPAHHVVEHGLDFLIAVSVLCAVYTAGSAETSPSE
ncbi:DUF7471 family protein [Natronorarus salvus]|uniref:DUF7471 family protein n=1 Tax=Natronorarus salvus TaxID=3117733 RepID=UPI002F2624EA